jgi:hypothetical protein
VSGGPTLGLGAAARACGVAVTTVRRHRDELIAHGATTDATGWVIPVSALVVVGLMPRTTPPDTGSDTPSATGTATPVATGVGGSELERLREELAEARIDIERQRGRAERAEAEARERDRIIDAQAVSLRLLEAGPSAVMMPTPVDVDQPTTPTSRPWWRRRS